MNKIGKDTKIRQKSKISTIESRQCNSKLDQEMHGKKKQKYKFKSCICTLLCENMSQNF